MAGFGGLVWTLPLVSVTSVNDCSVEIACRTNQVVRATLSLNPQPYSGHRSPDAVLDLTSTLVLDPECLPGATLGKEKTN